MSTPYALELKDVRKNFGKTEIIRGVNLAVAPGERVAVIGPNGAGKSTLFNLISGRFGPTSGEILLNGQAIQNKTPYEINRMGLARSFQISSVMPDYTVLQNVALAVQGAQGRSFGFWRAALSDRHLIDPARAHIAHAGLEGREAVTAAALSHGERRKLEIAMALALKPRAFLLDEPMAGMGPEGARQLTPILSELRTSAPILLVEHDMDAVFALADRISVLVYGRIIATGTVAEIRANPEVRASYLGEEA